MNLLEQRASVVMQLVSFQSVRKSSRSGRSVGPPGTRRQPAHARELMNWWLTRSAPHRTQHPVGMGTYASGRRQQHRHRCAAMTLRGQVCLSSDPFFGQFAGRHHQEGGRDGVVTRGVAGVAITVVGGSLAAYSRGFSVPRSNSRKKPKRAAPRSRNHNRRDGTGRVYRLPGCAILRGRRAGRVRSHGVRR